MGVRVGGIFQLVGVVETDDYRFPRTRHRHHRYYWERVALPPEHSVAAPGVEQAPSEREAAINQIKILFVSTVHGIRQHCDHDV